MAVRFTIFFLFIVFLDFPCLLHGQNVQLPFKDWKAKLSVKKDLQAQNLFEVYNKLKDLPANEGCDALTLLKDQGFTSHVRYKLRLRLLEAYLYCYGSAEVIEALEKALQQAYEIEDDLLATQLNLRISAIYEGSHDYGLAAMYGLTAKELIEKAGVANFLNVSNTLYQLGDILYKSRDYRAALKISQEAVNYHGNMEMNKMDSLTNYWEMNAWNVIGLCYERLGVYDSAFISFNHALEFTKGVNGDPFWPGLLNGNRGDVYFLQGRYDSAEVLLQMDYEQSIASNQFHNAALSLQRLARINNSRGLFTKALSMVKEAEQLERMNPHPDYKAEIFYTYSLVYKNLNNTDSTFAFMQRYIELHDQLEKNAAHNRTEIVQLRMDNRENVVKILILNKEKKRITLIRNFTILLILLLAVVGYLYLNRIRLKLQLRKQEAEAEAAKAKEQLNVFTENLRDKTRLIENLQAQLLNKELNAEQIERINELSHHTILTDDDWEHFKNLFTKVYPGFFLDLKGQVPDITLAEQRMAALIKLQIPSKDAATMLGISPNSVYKSRQRLRQRLSLENDDELDVYFSGKPMV